MPGVVRKLLIYAAVDGLILQPITQGKQRVGTSVKVDYKGHAVSREPCLNAESSDFEGFESHGIIGLLKVSSSAFLITITRSQQVAQLWNKNIYVIKDIGLIPVSSQEEARRALAKSNGKRSNPRSGKYPTEESSTPRPSFEDAGGHSFSNLEDTWLDEQLASRDVNSSGSTSREREPGVAEEVIGRRGVYGRFAESWFSRRGWLTGQRRSQGMSSQDDLSQQTTSELPSGSQPLSTGYGETTSDPSSQAAEGEHSNFNPSKTRESDIVDSLMPKLLHTVKLLFTSDTFYYSHDLDITRSLTRQDWKASDLPLSSCVDSEYFWNHDMTAPFANSGCDEMILPIMQGFVGQRSFVLAPRSISEAVRNSKDSTNEVVKASSDELKSIASTVDNAQANDQDNFLLTLISRRSVKRPGLRYLRRGIDDNGSVANSVETEQILSKAAPTNEASVYSFLQTRGSLPLFFSQTPYTFKPVPVLHGSSEAHQEALAKHFKNLESRYGEVHAVSLIDKTGVEAAVGKAYEENVQLLNSRNKSAKAPVSFTWFDFHHICRGMKFEKVSTLVDALDSFLTPAKWSALENQGSDTPIISQRQSGIVRTNCMDCLDRTNVVQSTIAQHVLSQQLSQELGAPVDLRNSSETSWFNALWADNGDAVSRAYAGTAALKGDYTRTKQRNIRGLLTDFSLTLSRYYKNLFDDFFAQAVIDRILGNVTDAVFVEFEANMTSADPGINLQKARQTAITSASKIVIEHNEDFVTGWALASPAPMPANTSVATILRATPFSHVLLLLSDRALYTVQYDWDNESVTGFERIALEHIDRIQWGTYITETMNGRQIDPLRNVGLLVSVFGSNTRLAKVSTGSLDSTTTMSNGSDQPHLLAFKAIQSTSSIASQQMASASQNNERELVKCICHEIAHTIEAMHEDEQPTLPGKSSHEDRRVDASDKPHRTKRSIIVEEVELVSLKQAEKATGYVEQIGYSLKKLVWG